MTILFYLSECLLKRDRFIPRGLGGIIGANRFQFVQFFQELAIIAQIIHIIFGNAPRTPGLRCSRVNLSLLSMSVESTPASRRSSDTRPQGVLSLP